MLDLNQAKEKLKKVHSFLFSRRFIMTWLQFCIFFTAVQIIFDSLKMYLPLVLRLFLYLIFGYVAFILIKIKAKK